MQVEWISRERVLIPNRTISRKLRRYDYERWILQVRLWRAYIYAIAKPHWEKGSSEWNSSALLINRPWILAALRFSTPPTHTHSLVSEIEVNVKIYRRSNSVALSCGIGPHVCRAFNIRFSPYIFHRTALRLCVLLSGLHIKCTM